MRDLNPRQPQRPLLWPDVVLDIADLLGDFSEPVYLVGGAVRDAFLHRPLHDLDLAVRTNAVQLARHIANSLNGDVFVLDAERDVGRALVNTPQGRMTIDVARFRGDDLQSDLLDRDFTLNALVVDLRGDLALLIDPLDGENDILTHVLRRCAPGVIASDPIRVLRAVRQSVQLGFRIEPETLLDVRAIAPQLAQISPERVRDEFIKLLALPRPAVALRVADVVGALTQVIPEAATLKSDDTWARTLQVIEILSTLITAISPARTDSTAATFGLGVLVMQLDHYRLQLREHLETEWPNERPHRALLALAALLYEVGTNNAVASGKALNRLVDERVTALRLSNSERERLLTILRFAPLVINDQPLTPLALYHFWSRTGAAGVDTILLALCAYLGEQGSRIHQDKWLVLVERARVLFEAYYDRHDQIVDPPALLDGVQLIDTLNLKPGPVIGKLIEHIREAQVTGEVRTVDDAIARARAYLAQ